MSQVIRLFFLYELCDCVVSSNERLLFFSLLLILPWLLIALRRSVRWKPMPLKNSLGFEMLKWASKSDWANSRRDVWCFCFPIGDDPVWLDLLQRMVNSRKRCMICVWVGWCSSISPLTRTTSYARFNICQPFWYRMVKRRNSLSPTCETLEENSKMDPVNIGRTVLRNGFGLDHSITDWSVLQVAFGSLTRPLFYDFLISSELDLWHINACHAINR